MDVYDVRVSLCLCHTFLLSLLLQMCFYIPIRRMDS